jgi:hypothetical protein
MPDSDPPGVVSHQVTLNTSSWTGGPGEVWMLMAVAGVVRVDPTGCVYLGSDQSDVVRDIVWPAGHTASREPDGSVTIRNRDEVVCRRHRSPHRVRRRRRATRYRLQLSSPRLHRRDHGDGCTTATNHRVVHILLDAPIDASRTRNARRSGGGDPVVPAPDTRLCRAVAAANSLIWGLGCLMFAAQRYERASVAALNAVA